MADLGVRILAGEMLTAITSCGMKQGGLQGDKKAVKFSATGP